MSDLLKSVGLVLGIIVAALTIYKFFKKSPAEKESLEHNNTNKTESVATRFIDLFEAHGVHRNEIPRFFGHGLNHSTLKDDLSLLENLNELMLEDACRLFNVRRQWLDGVDDQIYPLYDYYKDLDGYKGFIEKLKNGGNQVDGVLLISKSRIREYDALLIFEESIGYVGDKTIYKYYICNNWNFKYWKCRGYLTACIAMAWKNDFFIMGRVVSQEIIDTYKEGNFLLVYDDSSSLPLNGRHWYPEDMVVKPESYIDGINPEYKNFGLKSALKMWISFEEQGYMESGLPYKNVRHDFEKAFDKFT